MSATSTTSPLFGMVAGEASGDLLGGLLVQGLRQRWPDCQLVGIGGPNMQQQGLQAWWPHTDLAVRGYVEVIWHLRRILALRKQLAKRLLEQRPDVFIGIDAPDFNLGLEAQLKAAGIKTVHFVSPSIWAWRPQRIEKVRQSVDHVLCVFPFEPQIYQQQGISASYVGHPLASSIPMQVDSAAAKQQLGFSLEQPLVAVLPGSVASEVKHNAPTFLQAVQLLAKQRPELQFVLPTLAHLQPQLQSLLEQYELTAKVKLLLGNSQQALAACDLTLIASGTATLEAALLKKPMVIAYKLNWLSASIMRRQKLQPWVGLPNILCQDFVVPELLQEQATAQSLAQALMEWLDSPEKIQAVKQRFTQLHLDLTCDTATLTGDAIAKLLEPS